jgi:hypothetical protein
VTTVGFPLHESTPQLEALYYPYSRALRLETLKRAVLLFDKVSFLDSQPWFVRGELLRGEHAAAMQAVEQDYEYLRHEGVISIVNPGAAIVEYDTVLTANVRHDIGDDRFLDEAVSESATAWQCKTNRAQCRYRDGRARHRL